MDALAISSHPISYDFRKETWRHTIVLSFQSLGVIYGRLSTAPLYVLESIEPADIKSPDEIHELFSFIFWTLTIIPLLKYAFIVLRADDEGEGGPFSLYSLLCRHASVGLIPSSRSSGKILHDGEEGPSKRKLETKAGRALEKHKSSHYLLLVLALLGACMTLCDAVLTPAISVLSATSGLGRSFAKISVRFFSSEESKDHMANIMKKYIPTPAACAILVCLFTLQQHGTKKIGCIFAPIVIIWLLFISGFGLYNIIHFDAQIFRAISPMYMLRFIKNTNFRHWKLLSSIVLCIAGSETMYADLGHFSKRSIKVTFICFIYPVLVLTYAGQCAFLSNYLSTPEAVHLSESIPNKTLQHIFAILSLFASAVGSQATITAGFSIINQCQALNCFPRVKVVHTSEKILGQVYVPDANWFFMTLSLAITIGFHDVAQLGKATGLAITGGMLVTTCLMSLVIALYWERSLLSSVCFLLFFGSVETAYLLTNLLTGFFRGAWALLALFSLFISLMAIWHYGTLKKHEFDLHTNLPVEWLTDFAPGLGVSRVPGIGFVHSALDSGIPAFFSHFVTNLPAFHRVLVFVTFKSLPVPRVPEDQRHLVERMGPAEHRVYRCVVRRGYRDGMRDPHDFEDRIISSIGEYVASEDFEAGDIEAGVRANLPVLETSESRKSLIGESERKVVRFVLPPRSPDVGPAARRELEEIAEARESGSAYFMGRSHVVARKGSNWVKRLVIMGYVFLDRNGLERPVALNIPNAALLEVGTVYTI